MVAAETWTTCRLNPHTWISRSYNCGLTLLGLSLYWVSSAMWTIEWKM